MVWLKRMIKAPTCAERSCMAIVLLLFYLSPVLFFLWSFPGSLSISELILKAFVITLLKRKHPFNSLSFGSLLNRVHICIYTAWIGRRDLPLPGLSCCLVKYFNISGSELVAGSTRIKSAGITRCRVPRGQGVGVTTVGVGIAVACSVVGYVQVGPFTKGWSGSGTCVHSVSVFTWLAV